MWLVAGVAGLAVGNADAADAFIDRLQPANKDSGYQRDDAWVWCGSIIQGPAGRWHMFASTWTKDVAFTPNWLTNSRVVRAVADHPEGPYTYAGEVLPPRGGDYWDGKMTHNPSVMKVGDTYVLFYTGSTYDGPTPNATTPPLNRESPMRLQARANQRIGIATAPHPAGPWLRRDRPIIAPRPGQWDALLTTNPAPCLRPDGSILLLYKSTTDDRSRLQYGVALATQFDGPYERLREDPIQWNEDPKISYEDAFVWRKDDKYHVIFNDMTGRITGEDHAGGYAESANGIDWVLGQNPKAYSRTVRWSDGTSTIQGSLERPQLILQNGHPTHLVCATADGPGGFSRASHTWNIVIPLAPED